MKNNDTRGKLKILQVVHGFPPGQIAGTEVYTYNLSREFNKRHAVSIFHRINDAAAEEYSIDQNRIDGLEIFTVNNTFKMYDSFADTYGNDEVAEKFSIVLDRIKPDIVHIQHLLYLSAKLIEKAKDRSIPVVFTLHDFWIMCPQGQLFRNNLIPCDICSPDACIDCVKYQLSIRKNVAAKYALLKKIAPGWLVQCIQNAYLFYSKCLLSDKNEIKELIQKRVLFMRDLCSQIDVFIAPSAFIRKKFISFGISDRKIISLSYGFDCTIFHDTPKVGTEILRFGFIGNLMVAKGAHILVEVFNRVPADKAELIVYGRASSYKSSLGNYEAYLKSIAKKPHIKFMGAFDNKDISSILSAIDVLVVPSVWYENSPLVIHEAFLAKVPVIAARTGGIPELVTDGKNGLLFNPGDANDLEAKIKQILAHSQLINEFKDNIPQVKSIEENARELEKIYYSLV